MEVRYLNSDRLATILGVSKRTIQRRVKKGLYKAIEVKGKRGRNGVNLLIDIKSLPEETQKKYKKMIENNDTDQGFQNNDFNKMSKNVKKGQQVDIESKDVVNSSNFADNQENINNIGENVVNKKCQKMPIKCQTVANNSNTADNQENINNIGENVVNKKCQNKMSKNDEQKQQKSKDENINYTWITIKEACKLLNIKRATILYRLKSNKYIYKKGDKGRGNTTVIALESLPLEIQDKYKNLERVNMDIIEKQAINAMKMRYIANQEGYEIDKNINDQELDRAWEKYILIKPLLFCKRGEQKRIINKITKEQNISRITIYRYLKAYKNFGIIGLVRNKRSDTGIKRVTIPPVIENWIAGMAKRNQNISDLKYQAENKFKVHISRRRVTEIVERMNIVYTSKTSAANLEHKYEPYIRRTAEGHKPNDCWFGDTHPVDVLVKYKGKEVRPYLTAWLDAVTRTFMGYVLSPVPINQDNIRLSLTDAIDIQEDHYAYGLPGTIYIDNGKDFIARAIMEGIAELSKIQDLEKSVIRARPFNAKAKVIEPMFRQIESIIVKNFPGYIGNNPQNRPVAQKGKPVTAKWTYEKFCSEFRAGMQMYHNRKNTSIGASPLEKWREYEMNGFKPIRIDPQQLAVIFARREWRVVRRGFVQINNNYYYSDDLVGFPLKEKVQVRFHDRYKGVVWIFNQYGKYITTAIADTVVDMFNADEAEMEEIHRRKKLLKQKINKLDKQFDDLDIWEEKKKALADSIKDTNPTIGDKEIYIGPAMIANMQSASKIEKLDREKEEEKEYVKTFEKHIFTTRAEKEYLERLTKLEEEENQAGGNND